MKFLNKILGKKDTGIESYEDFWNWFKANEQAFFKVVKSEKNIEKGFFNKLSPKLEELNEGFFYVTGMLDEHTAELIFTPDGIIKNIVFVEELVGSAPSISNWKFTALKQPFAEVEKFGVQMDDYTFDIENLSFYPINHVNLPDKIDLVIAHTAFNEEDKSTIVNGVYIFIDNYLGELNSLTMIDDLTVISNGQAENDLIPITKLKDYLVWREKEFIEKYNGVRYDTENDNYSSFEAELSNGLPLIAIINSTLLEWDQKASHPWILKIEIKYESNNYGMPDEDSYDLLNKFEDDAVHELKDFEGYLNIGRETADGERVIYFACKDYLKPSKVLHDLTKKYSEVLELTYDIYKDKYWQSFDGYTLQ